MFDTSALPPRFRLEMNVRTFLETQVVEIEDRDADRIDASVAQTCGHDFVEAYRAGEEWNGFERSGHEAPSRTVSLVNDDAESLRCSVERYVIE